MDQDQPTKTFFLPEDFVFNEILTKLPVKSLVRFKCVSKNWLARISNDTSFIATHLDHHSNRRTASKFPGNILHVRNYNDKEKLLKLFLIGQDDTKLVEIQTSYITQVLRKIPKDSYFVIVLIGSCNGLVCIKLDYSDGPTMLVLWNPATREFYNLPEPIIPKGVNSTHWHYRVTDHCFGFDKYSEDYKVARIEEIDSDDENNVSNSEEIKTLDVQIYSKKRGFWRQLEGPSGCELLSCSHGGIVIDGAMHWAVLRGEAPAMGSAFRVLSLDLCTEELREVDGPACHLDDYNWHLVLIKWKGCLGGLMITEEDEYQIWSKTENIESNSGWTKVFTINPSLANWSFAGVLRDYFIIFDDENRKMFLYDPMNQEKIGFDDEFGRFDFHNICDYVPSLVSPN